MPMYSYLCTLCKLTFSMTLPINLRNTAHCPLCGNPADRQPAAPAFKVDGFNAKNGYSK
jgi:putative FmdB family regulatory protein